VESIEPSKMAVDELIDVVGRAQIEAVLRLSAEGLAEMFTVSRLGLSPSLSRCLVSTNVIESPHSGVRLRTI